MLQELDEGAAANCMERQPTNPVAVTPPPSQEHQGACDNMESDFSPDPVQYKSKPTMMCQEYCG